MNCEHEWKKFNDFYRCEKCKLYGYLKVPITGTRSYTVKNVHKFKCSNYECKKLAYVFLGKDYRAARLFSCGNSSHDLILQKRIFTPAKS